MAQKREVVLEYSNEEFVSLQDVLYAFNNSLSEEQSWAVCYQCAQYFEQNPSQEVFRDIYYYGIIAIRLSKEGDIKIEVNFNQGSGKGPPKKRSSFSLSREFKTVITPIDVRQALGTAIYKALDYGLSESEEPHLSPELEELIEFLTDHPLPTDDDEGIDIERDSDQDIEDSQNREHSEFQYIIDCCVKRLSSHQNAQLHYKAVCRALATETTELVTFLDNIVKGQEKLATTGHAGDDQPSVDDLERSDWARLWVQIMRELRHGVRLKKVEQVHLLPVEFELTPFEILLEDIRLGRYKLNRIMVNGDIPRQVKDDAHAVILDFIRSRPPLKPVNRRQLKERPLNMDPRELLLESIRKPQTLKPVKQGKVVVRKPTLDCDTNYSSEEESPKQVRKVIKPVAAFQVSNGSKEVSTDDSDSYFSDPDDDYRNHINAPVMSPLEPIYPDADDVTWKRAVAKDLVRQPSNNCSSVTRRHTISACDIKSGKKVASQHAPLPEEEADDVVHGGYFNRTHAARKATKIVSYRKKHHNVQHAISDNPQTFAAQNGVPDRSKSPLRHVSQCVLSKSHGNIVDNVFSVHNNVHDMSSSDTSRLSRSASVASISEPQRCKSPSRHIGRSQSPRMHAGRPESPVRHLSRSETFTCSVPRKSRVCMRSETHIATRCDSPQTRAMRHSDSFPPPRSESPNHSCRAESPRRHSVHMVQNSNDNACESQDKSDRSRRHSFQHAHGFVSHSSRYMPNSRSVQRNTSLTSACASKSKHESSKEAWSENHRHGNRSSSQLPSRDLPQTSIDNINSKLNRNSLPKSENNESLHDSKTSYPQDGVTDEKTDNVTLRRSRTAIVRARSRPDVRSKDIKDEEEKHFKLIESLALKTGRTDDNNRARPASEIESNGKTRSQVARARSCVDRSMVSRSIDSRIPVRSEKTASGFTRKDSSEAENGESETQSKPKRAVRLSRQSAIRTEGSEIRSKLQNKTAGEKASEKSEVEPAKQSESLPRESRTRRVGIVANENNVTDKNNSSSADESVNKQEVTSFERENTSRRREFRQVINRPILRSRSEVRPEMRPVKGSHNLPVDFEHNNLDHLDDKHVIVPPPEFRDPDDNITPTNETNSLSFDNESVPDVIKTSRAEFKVVDLLHVSWKTECPRQDPTNNSNPCSDCRPFPSHKWQNPIECLSLTLEEVTHIRCVLTKAELESLITNQDLYHQVSKGKVCFTCKKTKFSLFGQWGTKCKFCQRTVCNYCLRKMSVPTEHFEKIPVYTLSPVPLSPEVLEALKVYESTGSVPHSPVTSRKTTEVDNSKTPDEPETPVPDENKTANRRKSLQRSHTIGVGVGSRPPPNKALLKGPQMSICCDCKTMIMEIIRASRSSVSLITGKQESQDGEKNKDSMTPRGQISARSSVVMRPRHLHLEERPRPRSMLDNFKSFNFSKTSTDA